MTNSDNYNTVGFFALINYISILPYLYQTIHCVLVK